MLLNRRQTGHQYSFACWEEGEGRGKREIVLVLVFFFFFLNYNSNIHNR